MKTKVCYKCKKVKSLNEFYKNKQKRDGLQSCCKECAYRDVKIWQQKNKEKLKKYHRDYRKKNREWADNIKIGLGCQICGYNKCSKALVFHHRNSKEKELDITFMINNSMNKQKILKEIKKCQILCENCHRELHWGI